MAGRPRAPLDGETLGPGWVDHETLGLTRTDDPNPAGLLAWNTPTDAHTAPARSPAASISIAVPGRVTVHWDVAMVHHKRSGLTGGGKCLENYLLCTKPSYPIEGTPKYNRKCNQLLPGKLGARGKRWRDRAGDGFRKFPDVEIVPLANGKWAVRSVTCFTVIRVGDPVEGAYPVVGKNVTVDASYGVRGKRTRPERDNPLAKGYYKDVAANLASYRSAVDKPIDRIYWWVRGSVLRHELTHHKFYQKWFEAEVRGFLLGVAKTLEKEARDGKLSLTREALSERAERLLETAMSAPGTKLHETYEDQASAVTALEFQNEAKRVLREGRALEAKAKRK